MKRGKFIQIQVYREAIHALDESGEIWRHDNKDYYDKENQKVIKWKKWTRIIEEDERQTHEL